MKITDQVISQDEANAFCINQAQSAKHIEAWIEEVFAKQVKPPNVNRSRT